MQRAIRKSENGFTALMKYFGKEVPIQHSWHDYPAYWRQSMPLAALKEQYGPNLSRLDGILFTDRGQALLEDDRLPILHSLRLLQLAVWLGVAAEFRAAQKQKYLGMRTSRDIGISPARFGRNRATN